MDSKPNLYALVVGIDAYPAHVRQLTGCISDIETFTNYLQKYESDNYNLIIQKRIDADATRNNITADFKMHLAKATGEDVVVFYYSGHGAQEQADSTIWKAESDSKLEGLVLYDSVPPDYQHCKFLADKELRYLINYAAKRDSTGAPKKSPHIVVITDCCHSGDNTRGGDFNAQAVSRIFLPPKTRDGGGDTFPQRAWADFLFSNDINVNDLKTKPIDEVLPQAKYVAMAACQSNELAIEIGGHGVFSSNLIDILERSKGVVTYRDLQNRIKNYIKNRFPQVPQIYASSNTSDLFRVFLGKPGGSKPITGNVQFNETDGWVMDMGAMYGISNQTKTIKILSSADNVQRTATINKILPNQTILTLQDDTVLDKKAQYSGVVEGFLSAPIAIFIDNIDVNPALETTLKNIILTKGVNLNLATQEDVADYVVRIFDGKYAITNRVDTDPKVKFKPLILPTSDLDTTFGYLNQISQYEYIKNLENTGDNVLSLDNVTIEFIKKGQSIAEPIVNEKGKEVVEILFSERVHGVLTSEMTIAVTSNDAHPIYVSLLYLSSSFGVMTNFFRTGVHQLEKQGDKVLVFDGEAVTMYSEPTMEIFNLPAAYTLFKLIVSHQSFDVTAFELEDLPTADKMFDKMRGDTDRAIRRSNDDNKNVDTEAADAWTTRTILLRNPNPAYDAQYKNKPGKFVAWQNTEGGVFLEKLYLS